jgi:hypothetical protein
LELVCKLDFSLLARSSKVWENNTSAIPLEIVSATIN